MKNCHASRWWNRLKALTVMDKQAAPVMKAASLFLNRKPYFPQSEGDSAGVWIWQRNCDGGLFGRASERHIITKDAHSFLQDDVSR